MNLKVDDRFQFEKHESFCGKRVDHSASKPVFYLMVVLNNGWRK